MTNKRYDGTSFDGELSNKLHAAFENLRDLNQYLGGLGDALKVQHTNAKVIDATTVIMDLMDLIVANIDALHAEEDAQASAFRQSIKEGEMKTIKVNDAPGKVIARLVMPSRLDKHLGLQVRETWHPGTFRILQVDVTKAASFEHDDDTIVATVSMPAESILNLAEQLKAEERQRNDAALGCDLCMEEAQGI
jgi:hypothetical protein